MANKYVANKYYWLKLKRDFFKRHDIRIIETMPNGKDYVLFYLKLLAESVPHDGGLRFNETVPYSEEMLSTITNTNIDIVRSAIKIFTELQLMEILDDRTIYMLEVERMTGSETEWAEKKRLYREEQKRLYIEEQKQLSEDGGGQKKTLSDKSKSKSKSKNKDKDLDIKYTLLDLKKDIYEEWNLSAEKEKALTKHRTRTNAMDKAVERAHKSLKTMELKDYTVLITRFVKCFNLSGNMKSRTLTEFFGQRSFQKDWLICEEYTDEGATWLYYKDREEVSSATVEEKLAKVDAARKAAGVDNFES